MWFKLLILFAFNYVKGFDKLDPLVVTKQGVIKGLKEEDSSIFLGIPYARIDKDNPFGIAQPYPKYDLIYEATEDSPACPQMLNGSAIGNLDCLRLNIFVPKNTSSRHKRPVIVWIYGGSFNRGYATRHNFGPRNLVKHNVIVVTFNYRIGPYGFMCLDTPQVPGNQGIKDQLTAMRWVKDNIAAFGGDVNNITLMGESAGAASIDVHLLSKTELLFDKVILQSGSILKPNYIIDSNINVPLKIAEKLGFKTGKVSEAIFFLANTDPKLVITATSELSIALSVCIEKEFDNVESVLTDRPYNLDIPKVKGINILAGYNSREGLVMNAINPIEFINNSNYFHDSLENIFVYDEDFKTMEDIVRHFYIGDAELTDKVRNSIINFQSDFFFNFPLQWSLDRFLKNDAGNIYQYMFSYEGRLNYIKNIRNISLEGVSHGDELGYLFELDGNERTPSTEDQLVIDRITTIWTNFAKYGNPLPVKTELLPISWEPITEDNIPYLNINVELMMKMRPFKERLAFWKLFFIANQHRLKGFTVTACERPTAG